MLTIKKTRQIALMLVTPKDIFDIYVIFNRSIEFESLKATFIKRPTQIAGRNFDSIRIEELREIPNQMANSVESYWTEVETAKQAMTQDYYNNEAPTSYPTGVPGVPEDQNANQLISTEECPFKYAELTFPGKQKPVLAIVTPYEAEGGSGLRLHVREEKK